MREYLEKLKKIVSEGLFLAGLLGLTVLFAVALLFEQLKLPNLAEMLPADETQGFLIVNMGDYLKTAKNPSPLLTEVLSTPLQNLDFFEDDLGLAWVDDELLTFMEIRSKKDAETFLNSLLQEDEELMREGSVTCFPISEPICFSFKRGFLILGGQNALTDLTTFEGPTVESSSGYQNVRGRLSAAGSAFIYLNLESAREKFITTLGNLGFLELGFLESISNLFPDFGLSIRMESENWFVEAFTAVDKSALGGEAFFRFNNKFDATFPAFSSGDYAFEFSGHELSAQISRIQEILEQVSLPSSVIFKSTLSNFVTKFFGPDVTLEGIAPLFGNEYYFGYTPGEDFLFMLELTSEEELKKAAHLKDQFTNTFRSPQFFTTEKGELRAELVPITQTKESYEGTQIYIFSAGKNSVEQRSDSATPVAAAAFLDNLVLVASSQEALKTTLDRIQGRQEQRNTRDFESLLAGADDLFILSSQFLPEEHILKTLLTGVRAVQKTQKIFDDGVFTRLQISFE